MGAAACGKGGCARGEDEIERWLRAIRSRKLAMHAVSLHNRKLDAESKKERERARKVGEGREEKGGYNSSRMRHWSALHLQRNGGGDGMTRVLTLARASARARTRISTRGAVGSDRREA